MFSEPQTRELLELFIQNRLNLPRETMLSFFDPDPEVDVTAILPRHQGADCWSPTVEPTG